MNDESKLTYDELKEKLLKIIIDFSSENIPCHGASPYVLRSLLVDVLGIIEYQTIDHPNFTYKQRDHICYQIGEWYLLMKPLLEGQHNLGYMKEKLKLMICGDE